jgi:lysophospholipase L1-like esterase
MTTAYTTGTIQLFNGSAAVVGIGTAWQTSLITGGTIHVQAPGGNSLPILSIDDDTHITAALRWEGADGVFPYALIRDTTYNTQQVANANTLAELIAGLRQGTIFKYDVAGTLANKATYDTKPQGFAYLAIDTNPARLYVKLSATAADWAGPFSYAQGPQGIPGPTGFTTFRGTYAAGTAYARNDGVLFNGSSYVALQNTTGNAPPTFPATANAYWSLLASKGADGAGIGDVVGPAVAVDGDFALFNGTTGKLIKDGTPSLASTLLGLKGDGATFVFDGDSITYGYGTTTPATDSFPAQFMTMPFAANKLQYFNFGASGSYVADLVTRYAGSVKPHRPTANGGDGGKTSYLIIMIGINNLVRGDSAASIIAALDSYINTAVADGFTVVLSTLLPTTAALWSGYEFGRINLNNYIRDYHFAAQHVWDAAATLDRPQDGLAFGDGVHPTRLGGYSLARDLNNGMRSRFIVSNRRNIDQAIVGMTALGFANVGGLSLVDFTNIYNTEFDSYTLIGTQIGPNTDSVNLLFRFMNASGQVSGTQYRHQSWRWTSTGQGVGGSLSDTVIGLNPGELMTNTLGYQVSDFVMTFSGPRGGNFKQVMWQTTGFMKSTSFVTWVGGGYMADPNDVTGFRFLLNTGGFAQGSIALYGRRLGA